MIDLQHYKDLIAARLYELGERMHEIDDELGHQLSPDLADQAIDLEDDEVLEGLGLAAQKEVALLKRALERVEQKTYGICRSCDEPISEERLKAVLYAPLCKTCAGGKVLS